MVIDDIHQIPGEFADLMFHHVRGSTFSYGQE